MSGHSLVGNENMAGRRLTRREIAIDIAAFTGTVIWAAVGGWEARDLVWALWLSSLVVGYATIVTSIARGAREHWNELRLLAILGGAGLLAFFTFHFGMFHFVHGVFLNMFFPLIGDGRTLVGILGFGVAALANYWLFVVLTLLSRLEDVDRGRAASSSREDLTAPYKNVVRMHILIFVFAGLHAAGLSQLAIYPVLAAYFFPWQAVRKNVGAGTTARGSRQVA